MRAKRYHMLWLDSDVQFVDPRDVLTLIGDEPFSAAIYVRKHTRCSPLVNPVPDLSADPVIVRHVGAGAVVTRREVFETLTAQT